MKIRTGKLYASVCALSRALEFPDGYPLVGVTIAPGGNGYMRRPQIRVSWMCPGGDECLGFAEADTPEEATVRCLANIREREGREAQ